MTYAEVDALCEGLTKGITEACRDFVEEQLAARDAKILALEARLNALEGGAGKHVEDRLRRELEGQ